MVDRLKESPAYSVAFKDLDFLASPAARAVQETFAEKAE
jgi:hypothetical protein